MAIGWLIGAVCFAQVLAQVGAFSVPALLPALIDEWTLSKTEAGWMTGIFYAGYTIAVPVLVSLTDRIDPKRVYLFGVAAITAAAAGFAWFADGFVSACLFRALWGLGWAGTYMPGLKALSDIVEGPQQSRAVSAHAASIGLSGAASFLIAETLGAWYGWRWGIGFGAIGAALSFLIVLLALPGRTPARRQTTSGTAFIDFRPVLKNRSALGYSIGYMVHTWEMSALRSWVVTFLTFAAMRGDSASLVTPATIAMALGLVGTGTSVLGNELARRFGRKRFIVAVMLLSAAMAAGIGFSAGGSYPLAVVLCLVYAGLIWADSSSLTAGTVGSAEPERRGATMAIHSMLGYFGGFLGPLILGISLDLAGGNGTFAWGFAFLHLSVVVVAGAVALHFLRPRSLSGDRS